jgi:integrase
VGLRVEVVCDEPPSGSSQIKTASVKYAPNFSCVKKNAILSNSWTAQALRPGVVFGSSPGWRLGLFASGGAWLIGSARDSPTRARFFPAGEYGLSGSATLENWHAVLTTEQARSFLRTASHSPQQCLFALALTTGMRPSEYLALCWRDIDWDRGTISVVRTPHKNEGRWTFSDTKRVRSRRVVELQMWVLDLLRKLKGGADEAGAACDSVFADLIFSTTRGEPINEEYLVKKHFKPLLREAGLPNIRLYDLRHTSATLALTVGVAPKVVSEQLGHASAAFTLDTYSHVLPHMQDEAAAKEAALTNGPSL